MHGAGAGATFGPLLPFRHKWSRLLATRSPTRACTFSAPDQSQVTTDWPGDRCVICLSVFSLFSLSVLCSTCPSKAKRLVRLTFLRQSNRNSCSRPGLSNCSLFYRSSFVLIVYLPINHSYIIQHNLSHSILTFYQIGRCHIGFGCISISLIEIRSASSRPTFSSVLTIFSCVCIILDPRFV